MENFQEKVINYEQSAGEEYEKKLGGLHADCRKMKKITEPIVKYIKVKRLKAVSIGDLGGGTGNLLEFIIKSIQLISSDIKIEAYNIDINPKQLGAVKNKTIKPILADVSNLSSIFPKKFDVLVARNLYHYLALKLQQKVSSEAFNSLKPSGIFLNAFVSCSENSQRYVNKFWTDFATMANVKKQKTVRHFVTKGEIKKMFKSSGFHEVNIYRGFKNNANINGQDGFAGKYPSLTLFQIRKIEKQLLSLPEEIKKELNVKEKFFKDIDNNKIKTLSISQSVYLVLGKKKYE